MRKKLQLVADPRERVRAAMDLLMNDMDLEEVEDMAEHFEQVVSPPRQPPAKKTGAIASIKGGKGFSKEELFTLEADQLRLKFARRRELLKNALTTSEVAKLLKVSRQTPHDRVKSGALLAISEKGAWLFPEWQFDENGQNGVVKGFSEVLAELEGLSPLEKISWFVKANPHLQNLTPLAALKKNQVEKVARLAQAIGKL